MNEQSTRLIKAVLDAIAMDDDTDTPRLTDERLLALIHGRQPLTERERRLMARSAATRDRLSWLRHRERARALAAWQAPALAPRPLQLLAAADDQSTPTPLRLVGEQYSVHLTPVDLAGEQWHIAAQIAAPLIAATPAGFRLTDSEGQIWLSGHPDARGLLVGFWNGAEPLWQRIQRVRLELAPL